MTKYSIINIEVIFIFINFTNHNSQKWSSEQIRQALVYGEILDLPFPDVSPALAETEISALADRYAKKIMDMKPDAVLCQGEFSLAFAVANVLLDHSITVLTACSKRICQESFENGRIVKKVVFEFSGFRKYAK